ESTLAAATRTRVEIPLISPTAYEVPAGEPRVLSLNAFDPGAAEALAEWAAASGIRQVAMIHPSRGASADEARLFSERFQALGGSVLRSFSYEPGVTFWESQILGAAALRPDALVLPVPPEDLPGMAPQVTFFGLDTLGIRILGTGGWTDPRILEEVDPRHTTGVVVATPMRSLPDSEGYRRFRDAYERHFRRSLVDGTVQALGYDAASLVFRGIYAGAGAPGEVALALEQVRGLQGATGSLSVVDGEVRRLHHVVCLQDRTQHPIQAGQLPAQLYRPYQPDEETGVIPEGPGRPSGFACPLPLDTANPADTASISTP
ncbi:MAG TPA: ABC transporter substrate-binding protein, partial [Longimicrobiales bacterium]|nr:ABC transporter substrate-binding protein [Longimicrobiales bacterium]